MNPAANRRLQLATRIHYALLRELGHGIDVGRLLKQPLYARDVLLVCDACDGNDLPRLARAFRGATEQMQHGGSASGTSTFGTSTFGTSTWSSSTAFGPISQLPHAAPRSEAQPQSISAG